MYLGVIVPTQEDIDALDKFLTLNEEEEGASASFVFRTGFIDNLRQDRVSIVSSGIGKVNAAITAQFMFGMGCTSAVLMGTAGALSEDLKCGDIIVPDIIMSHDSDTDLSSQVFPFEDVFRPDDYMMNLMHECSGLVNANVSYSPISSGDTYISDPSSLFTTASAVDMESYAFAQACTRNERPFIVIKSISNNADTLCYESENSFVETAALMTAIFAFNLRDTSLNKSVLHLPPEMLATSLGNIDLHPDRKAYTDIG